MKKLIILAFLTLPAYANVEICNHQYCMDWPEYCVKSIETTDKPQYGVNVYTNGDKVFIPSEIADAAMLMLMDGYESLKDYYKWTDDYYWYIIKQQNKANLGVH